MHQMTMQHVQKENRRKPSVFAGFVEGAEGLEPSARGFGVDVGGRTKKQGRPSAAHPSRKPQRGRCWFGAMDIFRGPKKAENPRKALTIVPDLSKEALPFPDNLIAAGLDDFHNVSQGAVWDAGVVVTQVALAGSGDPDLRGVGVGCALADVDMDGLQGVTLIGPEKHPVGADLKDLRHGQIPPPGRIPESNGRWIQSPADSGLSPPG